jgi:hypothetical protein
MKVELLCLGAANKPPPISEGVAEIRINSQPCKGTKMTIRHMQARRTPRVATVHDAVKEMIRSHLTLVHVFHTYASTDTPWVAHALSHYTSVRYGRIASVLVAHDTTQFGDSTCLIFICTTMELRILDQTTLLPSHLVFSIFPQLPRLVSNYDILSTNQVLNIPISKQGKKIPKSREWNISLDFYRSSIH